MAVVINGNGAVTGLTALPSSAMASKTIIQSKCTPTSDGGQISSSSDSYADVSGLDVVITPKFSNSTMILVTSFHVGTAFSNRSASVRLTFNHSGISQTAVDSNQDGYSINSEGGAFDGYGAMCYTHTPNTTNEITYRFQFRNVGANSVVYLNRKVSRIIAYEVAA
tara:strand:+ start:14 stop:511 length:498 start_codon:yes stop_codon:yes gene_type:complete